MDNGDACYEAGIDAMREQLKKTLGREPDDEEFEDYYDAYCNAEMEAHRPEYERKKRWTEPAPDEGCERDDPKTYARTLAGL